MEVVVGVFDLMLSSGAVSLTLKTFSLKMYIPLTDKSVEIKTINTIFITFFLEHQYLTDSMI